MLYAYLKLWCCGKFSIELDFLKMKFLWKQPFFKPANKTGWQLAMKAKVRTSLAGGLESALPSFVFGALPMSSATVSLHTGPEDWLEVLEYKELLLLICAFAFKHYYKLIIIICDHLILWEKNWICLDTEKHLT